MIVGLAAARAAAARLSGLVVLCLGSAQMVGVGATAAFGQSPIPGNYAPNAVNGMKAAVMPPQGTRVIENGSIFYNTRKFVDGAGNEIPIATTNAFSNRTILGFVVPDLKILGGDFNPAIIPVWISLPIFSICCRPAKNRFSTGVDTDQSESKQSLIFD